MPSSSHQFQKIGLVAKPNDPSVPPTVTRLAASLKRRGLALTADVVAGAVLGQDGFTLDEIGERCDLCVVIGGDGTLLNAARTLVLHNTPIVGINRGHLGFLVDVSPDDMSRALDQILAGEGHRENRMMLEARPIMNGVSLGPHLALNDVVLRNQAFARMLEFDSRIDGRFISSHRADGMVVSTPTGSTAYALSGGGPILHPGVECIALVPICPHTLSDRPLVLGGDGELELLVQGTNHTEALVTFDGQTSQHLSGGDVVKIRKAKQTLTLIHPPGYDYFNILRSKLRWGRAQAPAGA